jgi:hypothetical protein
MPRLKPGNRPFPPMPVVLTICSANYLAHAKVLGDSVTRHNPGYRFVIGLADRLSSTLASSFWQPHELVSVEDIGIEGIGEMVQKYDVVEFNTAVKPFFIDFLYRRPDVDQVIYLDPDILVFSSFTPLSERLRSCNLIVTPHSCTFDNSRENIYYETGMLSTGVYNLGFLGTSRNEATFSFLKWWQHRLREYCYYTPGTGIFVDQLWVTLASLYFPGVFVEKHPGYNMSYWNSFERIISQRNDQYFVNNDHPLVFYHFSSFDPEKPGEITKRAKSMTKPLTERPDLAPLYSSYSRLLVEAGYAKAKTLSYSLRQNISKPGKTIKARFKNRIFESLRSLPAGAQDRLRRTAQLVIDGLK